MDNFHLQKRVEKRWKSWGETMAEIRKLKDRLLPKLAQQEGMHGDGGGLFLRVRNGRASWVLRVTSAGVRTEVGLGGFPTVPLSSARELAEAARAKIRAGQPVTNRRPEKKDAPFFRDIYIEAIQNQGVVRGWTSAQTKTAWERLTEIWILPALGGKRVDDISRDDVLAVLEYVNSKTGASMHIVRSKLAGILAYCKARGFIESNPAVWAGNLDQFLPGRSVAHTTKHYAAPGFDLLRDEIVPVLIARDDDPIARFVMFGVLTVLRSAECVGALWSEIDLQGGIFSVPWERIKTAKRSRECFRVPLSNQAVDLLSGITPKEGAVFVGQFGRRLDRRVGAQLLSKWGVTFHGMRSTFRDWCAREDIPFHVAEKCLNHAVGNQVVRAYFRDDLLDQRREVMQRWADAVMPRGTKRQL